MPPPTMVQLRPMKGEVKDTHIYFPAKVLAQLKKMAADNRRSVSAEIVMAVESRISEWKSKRGARN